MDAARYGDHLELLNPGTRERMASLGAPEGFEDVVADKAAELGGTVVVATFTASRFVPENRDLAAAEAETPVNADLTRHPRGTHRSRS